MKKTAHAHIEKVPHYDPEENKIEKDFDILEAFDMPQNSPDDHIQLDLNFDLSDTKPAVKKDSVRKQSHDHIDNLIGIVSKPKRTDSGVDDLIDIEEKDDGNLINFKKSNTNMPYQAHYGYFYNGQMAPAPTGYGMGYTGMSMGTGYPQYPATSNTNAFSNPATTHPTSSHSNATSFKKQETQDFFKF